MTNQNNTIKHRTLVGAVVSDKMTNTVVVRVDRLKRHPKYEKRFRASKRYKAHDEKGEYRIGDRVAIEETRPLSHGKRWRVIKKIGERRQTNPSELESEPQSE